MLKIVIIGYGKMGKEIEKQLKNENCEISAIIDNEDDWKLYRKAFENSDVAIEFSTPNTVINNLLQCFNAHIPVVCGTTGWAEETENMIKECQKTSNALVYGSNFSIGANLFFKINELTAQWMNHHQQYDVMIEETHHIAKKDAPSGTAITTANIIINQLDRKNGWALNDDRQPDNINILAHRIGNDPGTHVVRYRSDNDCIEITHQAFSRAGFAQGAIKAAFWLYKNRGIHPFHDIFMKI